ncbi:MAG: hypothetical protein K0Q55_1479 [Verrucomicrobia bacterium]|jgi:hypothetical protein|nr:hypothetical protein [Verrucomicrobiota bacterium]
MSGGIKFPNGVFWGKAGWVYRAALDGICGALRRTPEATELLNELEDETDSARTIQFIDLNDWPLHKQAQFYEAIRTATLRFQDQGPIGWNDPSFFPTFVDAMIELQQLANSATNSSPPD